MAVSVFDLFKIGIGPSSSHTVGPMRAARLFALRLQHDGLLERTTRIFARLYGSLGATGKGHGSDKAVLLGLAGHEPDSVDVEAIPALLQAIRGGSTLAVLGTHAIAFHEKTDLVFLRRETLPFHANGMRFEAFDAAGAPLAERTYYSVGGGFVVSDEVAADGSKQKVVAPDATVLPYPFRTGAELLALTGREGCSIAGLMRTTLPARVALEPSRRTSIRCPVRTLTASLSGISRRRRRGVWRTSWTMGAFTLRYSPRVACRRVIAPLKGARITVSASCCLASAKAARRSESCA